MGDLSKHFSKSEFACSCCGDVKVDPKLIDVLEEVREHFGKPIKVNSGYRCKAHNTAIGGSPRSQHMLGTAADIVVKNISPVEVYDYLEEHKGGLGKYSNFTHIDVRGYPARW